MKKIIRITAMILICYCVFFAANYFSGPHYNDVMSERVQLAGTPEELEANSDLIVSAKILPDKENVLVKNSDGKFLLFGYTETKLEITEVFHGNVSAGDEIMITEEYFTTLSQTGTVNIWTEGNYVPAKENHEYLFFLKAYGDAERYAGMYYPIDLEYGKYVVHDDGAEMMNTASLNTAELTGHEREQIGEAFEIQTENDFSRYIQWYGELTQKYLG